MIHVIVGHRGTGKTKFLKELQKIFLKYNQTVLLADLDEEIEKNEQKTIRDIFFKEGEEAFRKYEKKALFKFFDQNMGAGKQAIVALGAGYREVLPESASVLWLQRRTDDQGRIFLDRPRLDKRLPPLVEYFRRHQERNIRYQSLADETLFLPENYKDTEPWLPLFWGLTPGDLGGCLTVLPWFLGDKMKTRAFLNKRLNWGINYFELRTDLISIEQMHWIRELVPEDQLLLSVRGKAEVIQNFPEIDWALELGDPPAAATIASLHERVGGVKETVRKFESYTHLHLKLAIEISNWQELRQGYEWWQEDPANRSFLPRSSNGRWSWFRLLHKYQMRLNFFREDIGSSQDQPYFVDWCNYLEFAGNRFGAVLGSPIIHSWTPEEQRKFWASQKCNSLAIEIKKDEWTKEVLEFLRELGLTYAAVTSPLKGLVAQDCHHNEFMVNELQALNTLKLTSHGWEGYNTDYHGFKILCQTKIQPLLNKPLEQWQVAVWGGGGTLPVLKKLFPQANCYSARTGKIREVNKAQQDKTDYYDILIWAVGRNQMEHGAKFPDESIQFQNIVDLNYSDNSPGKELALLQSINYISGKAMFRVQAQTQRKVWSLQEG